MKIDFKLNRGVLQMYFKPEENDGVDFTGKVKMGRSSCLFYMPIDWTLGSVHPDVLALSVVLIVYPFVKDRIVLPMGVSSHFHDQFKKNTGKEIRPIDPSLSPRKSMENAIPGLAFSGGIDSTAALTILPEQTCCIFLDRILPEGSSHLALYNKEAAYFACDTLQQQGRQLFIIRSDFEYVRDPRGFSLEMSMMIPALLLSDYIGLDSIASGQLYDYYTERSLFKSERLYNTNWVSMFKSIDIPLNWVTLGMSEVATYKIVLNSPYRSVAQSCMRGTIQKPCLNCSKCFRKKLIEMTLLKQNIDNRLLDCLFGIIEARTYLRQYPMEMESGFAYLTAEYKGNHHLMTLLRKKTKGDLLDMGWIEKWYRPAKVLMARKYRKTLEKTIANHLEVMNKHDEGQFDKWCTMDFLHTEEHMKAHHEFVEALNKHKKI